MSFEASKGPMVPIVTEGRRPFTMAGCEGDLVRMIDGWVEGLIQGEGIRLEAGSTSCS